MNSPQRKGKINFKEKRSEFVGLLFPLSSLDQFQPLLKSQKKQHPKARHICWAYRINETESIVEHSSDAGEPGGTAGLPILNQLLKIEGMNVALFVIRYFGGIKLGKRGLMDAYGKAAELVIQSVSFRPWIPTIPLIIKSDIKYYSDIVQVISKFEGQIRKDFSGETLNIDIELPLDQEGQLSETLNDGSFGQVEIKKASANNTKEGSEVKGVGKRNSHPL